MANLRVSVLFAAALALAVSCSPAFAAAFDLSGFELVAENEHLALYLNEASVEFAVLEKASGEVWFSNPYDRMRKEQVARGSARDMLNAQVVVSYYSANRLLQMDSYNDSVRHGQHVISRIPGGFRIDFEIGRRWQDQHYMPIIISEERFNQRILANIEDERDRKFLRDQYVLFTMEKGYVDPDSLSILGVDMEALFGDYGFKVLDSLRAQDKRRLLQEYLNQVRDGKRYTTVGEIQPEDIAPLIDTPTLMLRWNVREWDKETIWQLAKEAGYTPEDVVYDHEMYNITPPYPDLRNFKVSIEVFLDGETLVVRIPAGSISYPDRVLDPATDQIVSYPMTNVALLPYFGAADAQSKGYIFVPDGSGALIFTNNGKTTVPPYNGAVYGRDFAAQPVPELSTLDMAQIHLPVFGLKEEGRAFLAIIEDGDGLARVEATVAGMRDSFNKVWASFDVLPQVRVFLEAAGELIHLRRLSINMYQARPYLGDMVVRYAFLTGDEATYAGMARRYRQYLLERYQFQPPEPGRMPLVLHVLGAIDRIRPVLGVPSTVVTPLTTFDQARRIVEALEAHGVGPVHLRYLGWLEGGLRHLFPDRVRLEPELGTAADLRSLESFLESRGSSLFLDAGFALVRQNSLFDSFVSYSHASRFLNRNQAYVNVHNIATFQPVARLRMPLLSPSRYSAVIDRFASDYAPLGVDGLSVGDLGKMLYSDFRLDPERVVDRQNALEIVVGELQKLREKGYRLMLEGGNAYVLPYAAHVVEAPIYSRGSNILDQPVPFYAMATSGLLVRSAPPANLTGLEARPYLLKLLETGMLPSFTVAYASSSEVKHTDFHSLHSISYFDLEDEVLAIYREAEEVLGDLWRRGIIDHSCYTFEVCRTEYDDGTTIVVNYGRKPFEGDGLHVPALGYAVLRGGKEDVDEVR